jgi:hypothetical protein
MTRILGCVIVFTTALAGARGQTPDVPVRPYDLAALSRVQKQAQTIVRMTRPIDAKLMNVVELASDRAKLTIIICVKEFEAEGVFNVEEKRIQLPVMNEVPVEVLLRRALAQVKGTIWIQSDHIEIIPRGRAVAKRVGEFFLCQPGLLATFP